MPPADHKVPVSWVGDANTSESVILLPGDVEMSAYVGDDDGEARCKLCRYGDGKCTVGLRKIHVREDPMPLAWGHLASQHASCKDGTSLQPGAGGRVDHKDHRQGPGGTSGHRDTDQSI